jgi:hypothetical protein
MDHGSAVEHQIVHRQRQADTENSGEFAGRRTYEDFEGGACAL